MGMLERRDVSAGWQPDVDAATAPAGAFLRADNLTRDEKGVLALRRDSVRILTLAGYDVHSLQTEFINGVRCRLVGANDTVFLNGSVLQAAMDGAGDVSFGAHQGQIFLARGTSKHKFDGATLRTWGIPMTGGAPAVSPGAPDGKTFVDGPEASVPAFSLDPSPPNEAGFDGPPILPWDATITYEADTIVSSNNGTTNFVFYKCILESTNQEPPNATYWTVVTPSLSYVANHAGVAAGATAIYGNPVTGRGTMTATFPAPTDFTEYDNGTDATDSDLVTFYVYLTDPNNFSSIDLMIDVADGSFQGDYYLATFSTGQPATVGPTDTTGADFGTSPSSPTPIVFDAVPGAFVSVLLNVGWNKLQITRGQMARVGATSGADWSTVKAVRLVAHAYTNDLIAFDTLRILSSGLSATYQWCYVLAFNTGTYVALSGPSPATDPVQMTTGGALVIIPLDGARDPQANEIWLYRRGGPLPVFLRTAVHDLSSAAALNAEFSYNQTWEGEYLAHLAPPFLDNGPSNYVVDFEATDFGDLINQATLVGPGVYTNDFELTDGDVTRAGIVPTRDVATAAIPIVDNLSDVNTLIADQPLADDNGPPPDDIIDIEGPYFDRTYVLTADGLLHPSRQLNPDSFAEGQVIRICAADEAPYWVKKGIGGLYVGTSKDIYRLEGDGTELPDGSINFTKRPLNIDHPPINDGVVQEGNLLLYVANDGWRIFGGESTQALAGATSLLYRGYTRHGVSPVNLTTGRFRGAVSAGRLIALTPEGASTTSSPVLYRRAPDGGWERHVYTPNFRVLYRERDGTVLAGDNAGGVWQLDTPVLSSIPVTLWTPADDMGSPFARKTASDLHMTMDTGGLSAAITALIDGATSGGVNFSVSRTGLALALLDASALREFRQLQLQIVGSFLAFRYAGYAVTAVPIPAGVLMWDTGPIDLSPRELVWIRRMFVKVRASAPLTIVVTLDGAIKVNVTVPVSGGQDAQIPIDFGRGVLGRQARITVTSSGEFWPYTAQVQLRATGKGSEKPLVTVNAA